MTIAMGCEIQTFVLVELIVGVFYLVYALFKKFIAHVIALYLLIFIG